MKSADAQNEALKPPQQKTSKLFLHIAVLQETWRPKFNQIQSLFYIQSHKCAAIASKANYKKKVLQKIS